MPDLADILEFVDATGDVLAARVPAEGPAVIRWGSQLVVREGQCALFLRDGRAMQLFEPGRHVLTTQTRRGADGVRRGARLRRGDAVPGRGRLRREAALPRPALGDARAGLHSRPRPPPDPGPGERPLRDPRLRPDGLRPEGRRHPARLPPARPRGVPAGAVPRLGPHRRARVAREALRRAAALHARAGDGRAGDPRARVRRARPRADRPLGQLGDDDRGDPGDAEREREDRLGGVREGEGDPVRPRGARGRRGGPEGRPGRATARWGRPTR